MNALLEQLYKSRNGHYCHCVEVEDVEDLMMIAESIIEEESTEYRGNHSEDVIIEFLSTLEVYCLNGDNEEEVHAFSFREYIEGTL